MLLDMLRGRLRWRGVRCQQCTPLDSSRAPPLEPFVHVGGCDLVICQFVLNENARALRASKFVFLREMFTVAAVGTAFLFMDVTHRMWPEVAEVAGPNFAVSTPRLSSQEKCHYALCLEKQSNTAQEMVSAKKQSDEYDSLMQRFRLHKLAHDARMARTQ